MTEYAHGEGKRDYRSFDKELLAKGFESFSVYPTAWFDEDETKKHLFEGGKVVTVTVVDMQVMENTKHDALMKVGDCRAEVQEMVGQDNGAVASSGDYEKVTGVQVLELHGDGTYQTLYKKDSEGEVSKPENHDAKQERAWAKEQGGA